jgi:hypothetical protein
LLLTLVTKALGSTFVSISTAGSILLGNNHFSHRHMHKITLLRHVSLFNILRVLLHPGHFLFQTSPCFH